MESTTNKPRVFVSSTVHDFRDLRSALKYWLESFGLEVRMSEFLDFTRQPEQGTFDSCLKAIEDCHYYILLIGSRKGSEFEGGVSVTQQEYRVAVELARQDRIAPIIFVRGDVLTVLRDRKKLKTATGLDAIDTEASTVLENPDFVRGFVEEVQRTEVGRKGKDPSGHMWVYPFYGFRDLADALRNNLHLFGSIPRQTLLANLEWELRENVATLCGKRSQSPRCGPDWLVPLRSNFRLTTASLKGEVSLEPGQARWLDLFMIFGAPDERQIRSSALQDAISSREFLVYQQPTGDLDRSPELSVMYMLNREIERYHALRAYMRTRQTELFTVLGMARVTGTPANVLGLDLMNAFGLADLMLNILRASFVLLDYIADPSQGVQMPDLVDVTPLGERKEDIQNEQATHADVERWRTNALMRRFATGEKMDVGLRDVAEAMELDPELANSLEMSPQDYRWYADLLDRFREIAASEGPEAARSFLSEQMLNRVRNNQTGC